MLNNDNNMPRGQISVTELKDSERQPCEIWTRVMGYFRPLSEFNLGKKSEFFSRKYFTERKCTNKIPSKGL